MSSMLDKLRDSLKDRGISLAKAGQALGVSKSAVGHYLRGIRPMDLRTFETLCRLAGLNPGEVIDPDAVILSRQDERDLVRQYRSMTPEERTALALLMGQRKK